MIKLLEDAISKHIEMSWFDEGYDEETNLITAPYVMIDLEWTDSKGFRHNAHSVTIPEYGNGEASRVYSAYLGWRSQRNSGEKPVLDIWKFYEDMVLEHGSWYLTPDEKYNYNFICVDNTDIEVNQETGVIEEVGEMSYLVERTPIGGADLENDYSDVEYLLMIEPEEWWNYHLNIKSIDDEWEDLYENHMVTREVVNEIFAGDSVNSISKETLN